ncbi:hypothetical protein WMF04_27475 [Sorangium sp. So ce260]|uniref:hypothetical protein n=1 Tax=Sorangium sp. So ce260 TaxID=3133291 RepID=UPI003F62E606
MNTNLNNGSLRHGLRSLLALLLAAAAPACVAAPVEEPNEDTIDSSQEALRSSDASGWAFFDGAKLLSARSFNSSAGANHVALSGVGVYTVTFDGLGGSGGNVQVNSTGGEGQRCKVSSWQTVDTALKVHIRCHTASGAPTSSPFVVSYARFAGGTAPSSQGAYLLMNRTPDGAISTAHAWGAPAAVSRIGAGRYNITLTGNGSLESSVLVTAVGGGPEYCKPLVWWSLYGNTSIEVLCFGAGGAPADTSFSLRYIREPREAPFESGGYVVANDPTAADYTPSNQYHLITSECNDRTETVAAHRITTGRYQITYPEMGGLAGIARGAALATAVGASSDYCNVVGWEHPSADPDAIRVGVRCFNASGALVDSRFTQAYFSELYHIC